MKLKFTIFLDLTQKTTLQIKFVDFLLKDKWDQHEGNRQLEARFATEFKKNMRQFIMDQIIIWRDMFARSMQVKKSHDWVSFPIYE